MAIGDVKVAYGASATITITLASLATSTTLVAGRESTAVDNTANVYEDYLVGGKVTTGTTPTDNRTIGIWVYVSYNDTPLYPDVMDGTDSAETVTSEQVRNSGMRLAASINTNNTSDRVYWVAPFSVAALFGGSCPKFWGIFIAHDTGVNLNSTGSNHAFYATGVFHNVAAS